MRYYESVHGFSMDGWQEIANKINEKNKNSKCTADKCRLKFLNLTRLFDVIYSDHLYQYSRVII